MLMLQRYSDVMVTGDIVLSLKRDSCCSEVVFDDISLVVSLKDRRATFLSASGQVNERILSYGCCYVIDQTVTREDVEAIFEGHEGQDVKLSMWFLLKSSINKQQQQ